MSEAIELLRRALAAWDNPSMSMEIMFNEIRAFLDAETEAEPEAEAVEWMFQHEDTGHHPTL